MLQTVAEFGVLFVKLKFCYIYLEYFQCCCRSGGRTFYISWLEVARGTCQTHGARHAHSSGGEVVVLLECGHNTHGADLTAE